MVNIDEIKKDFQVMLEQKPKIQTKREIISMLSTEIQSLLDVGYETDEIIDVLRKHGCELKKSTLRNYLSVARREAKKNLTSSDVKPVVKNKKNKKETGSKPDIKPVPKQPVVESEAFFEPKDGEV